MVDEKVKAGAGRGEAPKIMSKPLPIILDEMDDNIRAAAEAARRAEEAARCAKQAPVVATKASDEAKRAGQEAADLAAPFQELHHLGQRRVGIKRRRVVA